MRNTGAEEARKKYASVAYDMSIRPVTPRERRAYLLRLSPEYLDHIDLLKSQLVEARGVHCEVCGKGSKSALKVHHRHYRTFLEEKLEDLVLICSKCHADLHTRSRENRLTEQDAKFIDPEWEVCHPLDPAGGK